MSDRKQEWEDLKEKFWKHFRVQQYNKVYAITNIEEHSKFAFMEGLEEGRDAAMEEVRGVLEDETKRTDFVDLEITYVLKSVARIWKRLGLEWDITEHVSEKK